MRSSTLFVAAVMALESLAAPGGSLEKRAPVVYLAGDSTMAENGGGSGTQGWGHYLPYSLSISVVNSAIGGRSARSYTVESRFQAIADKVKSGDIVIIEFGHNDGGSLTPTDNGRTDCPGAGSETCTSTYNGATVTVLTYPAYLQNAAKLLISKGAKVIISSPTPNNPWESGSFSYSASRFTTYSKAAASATKSSFVDHGQYTANIWQSQGKSVVDAFFPNDHTHTSGPGADTVAKAFVKGVACVGSANPLAAYVKNSTASIPGSCI
ncbi:secreted rhamnogalacturonan acetylesteras-like protein [Pseudovirgaria hyperparasitica]|uniref:Secreted rhamnogalacturonan acetylesteras-like protein n=1 Tax=Pseudovirgaria hyperparasitica TaxID=470096 RepID=A0A6A6W7Q2_9PEZI|nr:secreted rhamnogalacturonan acetylesteras-like protein [Pseudovirgaria hyperparasitica]KAF2757111.1 secreted rhamnogalacturonan acetylesteras-like protein [Pseudovirgaria hyperparasitica]